MFNENNIARTPFPQTNKLNSEYTMTLQDSFLSNEFDDKVTENPKNRLHLDNLEVRINIGSDLEKAKKELDKYEFKNCDIYVTANQALNNYGEVFTMFLKIRPLKEFSMQDKDLLPEPFSIEWKPRSPEPTKSSFVKKINIPDVAEPQLNVIGMNNYPFEIFS